MNELTKQISYTVDLTKQYHNLLEMEENDVVKDFYWDTNVVSMDEAGIESYYIQDDLGSPMALLNQGGNITDAYAFDEFGTNMFDEDVDEHEKSLQPFGYTGYQMDEVSGLYFAQARRYDAGNGRFVSEDLLKGNVYGPISLNAYLYCDNQSMNYIDLNGLHREDIKEYADEYADLDNPKRNPRFPAYPPEEGNCANFVSQCMFFAGVPMNDKWYCFEPEEGVIEGFIIKLGLKMYKPNGDPRYEHMIYNRTLLTDTWNCADAQYKYFTDSKNGFINNKDTDVTKVSSLEELNNVKDLQVGDLLYWDFDGDGKMDHASIVVDGDEGNIKFAANTTDYSDKLVSAGYQEGNDLYFVRLRDCVYD